MKERARKRTTLLQAAFLVASLLLQAALVVANWILKGEGKAFLLPCRWSMTWKSQK